MMQLLMIIALLASLLTGCSPQEASDEPPAASRSSNTNSVAQPPGPVFGSRKAGAEHDTKNLVAGCPGMHPRRRPLGSNCFGIFPNECGADVAARYVGELMTETLARRMEEIAPADARIIRPEQPVHDDFRNTRLNVQLDGSNRIVEVDCY